MTFIKNENGFSLVELLVAMAILMIVVMSFTLLYTTSFTGIFGAGRKSEAIFGAQEDIDNFIAGGTAEEGDNLTIVFDNKTIIVEGKEEIIIHEYEDGRSVRLYYFYPR